MADAVGFLLAGYETTSVALAMTTYFLSKDSEVQEKVASEIDDFFEKNPVSTTVIEIRPCECMHQYVVVICLLHR